MGGGEVGGWVGGRVGGVGLVGGGQGGCERRIKVFVEIQKNIYFFFWGGGGGVGGGAGVRWGSGWWGGWVRVDVKAMLGEGGDVGYGGCEPRVEGIVQGTIRYCTILRKLKKKYVGGEGEGQYLNQKPSLCIQKRKRKKKK